MHIIKRFLVEVLLQLGLFPQIKHGSNRFVLIFEEWGFVLKFPKVRIWRALKMFFKSIIRKRFSTLKRFFIKSVDHPVGSLRHFLFKGIWDNWREYIFYLKHKNEPCIFPTLFSFFGLVNITCTAQELPEEKSEFAYWMSFMSNSIYFKLTYTIETLDPHHLTNPENFCIWKGHVCFRDYGSPKTQNLISQNWFFFNSIEIDFSTISSNMVYFRKHEPFK